VSILTRNEIGDLSSRWSLVNLLSCGVSQREIAKRLGISLCKITRGSRELKKKNSALKRFVDEHKRALNRRSENRSTKEKKQCL
jgi:TrpR family trp operon transcriptional repressor